MSYKSLLFCPDERAAQVVTQVLSELDFTVEIALEPFATVKKLTDEHFDALVVDCHNEQDASLLFKAARNSTHNHSSLSVAVVEGQAGVAKAFRIGANLVLTKPINVEQSKGTLRVARGLLKKNENKGTSAAPVSSAKAETTQLSSPTRAVTPEAAPARTISAAVASGLSLPALPLAPKTSPSPAIVSPEPHIAAAATVPYSALEVEKDPTPQPEAADLAVLESMPTVLGKPAAEPVISALTAPPEPIAASPAGQATGAAAAPALEKKAPELKLAGAAPMVTNEPIVKEEEIAATDPKPAAVPAFSSLADSGSRESGGGKGLLKVAVMLLLFGAAGYFGWQKFQPLRYLHRAQTTVADQTTPSSVSSSLPESSTSSTTAPSTPVPTVTIPDASSAPSNGAAEPVIAAESHATNSSTPEQIEVQEMPMSRDMKVPPAAKISNAKPLVVKPGPAAATPANTMPVAPPSLNLPVPKNANATISELVSAPDAALPKPSPGTVRVSQGVSQGLLVKKVPPVYPPVALQMHREGVVQLLATISKTGDISNVKVISGDTMLARAAADAVLRWKYRPYLLNGNPVEIETQITMVFKTPQ